VAVCRTASLARDPRAVPALCELLRPARADAFRRRRYTAASALAAIGDPSALPALREVWEEPPGPDFNPGDDDYHEAWARAARMVDKAIRQLESADPPSRPTG
jgi:HEAT repeat protein